MLCDPAFAKTAPKEMQAHFDSFVGASKRGRGGGGARHFAAAKERFVSSFTPMVVIFSAAGEERKTFLRGGQWPLESRFIDTEKFSRNIAKVAGGSRWDVWVQDVGIEGDLVVAIPAVAFGSRSRSRLKNARAARSECARAPERVTLQ